MAPKHHNKYFLKNPLKLNVCLIKSFYTIGPDSGNVETKARAPHQMKAGGSVFFLASFLMKIFTILTNAPPAPVVRPTAGSMGEEMV